MNHMRIVSKLTIKSNYAYIKTGATTTAHEKQQRKPNGQTCRPSQPRKTSDQREPEWVLLSRSHSSGQKKPPNRAAAKENPLRNQQKPARPSARQRTPRTPGRQRGKPAREHHNPQAQTSGKGSGGPRTGTETAKTGTRTRGREQTGRTRRGGKHHKAGTGAARRNGTDNSDGPGRERSVTGTKRGGAENSSARHGGTNERVSATRATDHHRAASRRNASGNARHKGPKHGRQAPTARKPDHGKRRGRGKQGGARRHKPPPNNGPQPQQRGRGSHDHDPPGKPAQPAPKPQTRREPGEPHTRDKRAAKRPAATGHENRTTATNPDTAWEDGRNETPRAKPAHGAKGGQDNRRSNRNLHGTPPKETGTARKARGEKKKPPPHHRWAVPARGMTARRLFGGPAGHALFQTATGPTRRRERRTRAGRPPSCRYRGCCACRCRGFERPTGRAQLAKEGTASGRSVARIASGC